MESQKANLNNFISKNECGGLNIEGKPDISCLFDKSGNILKSISGDATLIISIKFHTKVHIVNFQVNGVSTETNPSLIKCYVNKTDIDFSDVEDMPPTQKFDLTKDINKKIKVNIPKWRGITDLTFYFENLDADHLEIKGIDFYGSSDNPTVNLGEMIKSENEDYKPIKGNADIIGIYNLSRGETVESFINKHKDKNIFVDFHATWCGPCKQLGPILCQKAAQIGALVLKVDVDQHQNIAAEKGISSIPVVMLYKNGIKTETMVGYNPSKLEDMINLARN